MSGHMHTNASIWSQVWIFTFFHDSTYFSIFLIPKTHFLTTIEGFETLKTSLMTKTLFYNYKHKIHVKQNGNLFHRFNYTLVELHLHCFKILILTKYHNKASQYNKINSK